MEPAHSDAVSKALGVDPIMVCASDFGWISRPRLWWLYPSILQATVDPASGKPLQWAKHGSYRRLRLEEPRQPESELVVDDLRFHPSVAAGRLQLPCATTSAEDDAGRPAPKRARQKLSEATKARWAADSPRFAPWHYTEEAMMTDKAGKLHVVPAPVRERLHHIPAGYTDTPHLDDRARHRVLANGWHWGVAQRLLTILLAASTVHPVTAHTAVPGAPQRATIQWVVEQFGFGGVPMEPPPREKTDLHLPDDDPHRHWQLAAELQHCTVAAWPRLEPALERVVHLWTHWRHDVHRIRQEVLAEIAALVEEMADDTAVWLARRSAPVRATYQTPGKKRHTQIPVILELLRRVGYPDMPGITDDLTNGEVRRTPGWRTRTDGRYSNPASLEQLAATNWAYVKARTSRLAAGTHTDWPNSSRRPGWAVWWGPRGHRPAGTFTPRRF